ncbi:MAG: DUF4259 domain-containing protein [Deferribacteraceae bacterium]|jgi:hypothetical protein|nr:DUF4259 domain-containing protein [Deferribacteraceae bacterium]
MGVWGVKALESDEAYDLIRFLEEKLPEDNKIELSQVITLLQENNFLSSNFEDIDAFYDNNAVTIAELYLEFKDNGKFSFPYDDVSINIVKSFTADEVALRYLLELLTDIQHNGERAVEREMVKFWRNSDRWESWKEHINILIRRLEDELVR